MDDARAMEYAEAGLVRLGDTYYKKLRTNKSGSSPGEFFIAPIDLHPTTVGDVYDVAENILQRGLAEWFPGTHSCLGWRCLGKMYAKHGNCAVVQDKVDMTAVRAWILAKAIPTVDEPQSIDALLQRILSDALWAFEHAYSEYLWLRDRWPSVVLLVFQHLGGINMVDDVTLVACLPDIVDIVHEPWNLEDASALLTTKGYFATSSMTEVLPIMSKENRKEVHDAVCSIIGRSLFALCGLEDGHHARMGVMTIRLPFFPAKGTELQAAFTSLIQQCFDTDGLLLSFIYDHAVEVAIEERGEALTNLYQAILLQRAIKSLPGVTDVKIKTTADYSGPRTTEKLQFCSRAWTSVTTKETFDVRKASRLINTFLTPTFLIDVTTQAANGSPSPVPITTRHHRRIMV